MSVTQRRSVLWLAAGAVLASGFSVAESKSTRASREESTGVVAGLTVGAAAAGPAGALVGAAAGAMFGDRWHRTRTERDRLRGESARLGQELQSLTAALAATNSELAQRDDTILRLRANNVSAEALSLDVLFRTNASELRSGDYLLLQQLGALLASRPQLKISVTGHADARGAAGYNFELSTARAAAVAEALSDGGARREQMWVEGLGASRAAALVDDADGLALERRVEIRIGFDSAALAQRGAP